MGAKLLEDKIKLNKSAGPVIFLGSTNAMPMMYAMELKKKGYEVIYVVDRPVGDLLNRPENHFPEIKYPYPKWIVEFKLPSQMLLPLARKAIFSLLKLKLSRIMTKTPQVYILNSLFTSLASCIQKESTKIISLSHGGDLDSWGDIEGAETLADSFSDHSFWKYFPKVFSKKMIKLAVDRQYQGYVKSDVVLYFPIGFNKNGDRVISRLIGQGVSYIPRFDISFEPLMGQNRSYKAASKKLVIFSGVRFTFETFTEGNDGYNKGNDEIIRGISLYYKLNNNIEVHFVEKGLDFKKAKQLCIDYGIEKVVVWHKEMRFTDLLSLYNKADICFDQIGDHWIGAIGAYALYLGKPLIANDKPHVDSELWPEQNPIYRARNAEEVVSALKFLSNDNERASASNDSKEFAERYLGPNNVINSVFELREF